VIAISSKHRRDPLRVAIAHVDLPNESKGGVPHQVHALANALHDRGLDVTVVTFSPAYEECCYRVLQLKRPPLRLRRLWPFFFAWRLAQSNYRDFDVVHAHGDNYLLRRSDAHPQVRTFHGSAQDEAISATSLKRRLMQRVLAYLERVDARVADCCTGVSEATRSRLPEVAHVIPNGVDLERFRPGEKSAEPTILFVGAAQGRKRGQFLAELFCKEVLPRFPEARLWAVSDEPLRGPDGLQNPAIVNFGRVSSEELVRLYREAWVFCLPSTYEGFGVPYIEAMASGTPVVASPNPGAREVLEEGAFGVVAKDDEIAGALCLLLSSDQARAEASRRGLEHVKKYSWQRVTDAYLSLYDTLLTAQAKASETEGVSEVGQGKRVTSTVMSIDRQSI